MNIQAREIEIAVAHIIPTISFILPSIPRLIHKSITPDAIENTKAKKIETAKNAKRIERAFDKIFATGELKFLLIIGDNMGATRFSPKGRHKLIDAPTRTTAFAGLIAIAKKPRLYP